MSWVEVLTLSVSVAAVVVTVGIGLLRFRHEQRLADREDARRTLAEAARELGKIKTTMRDALTVFDQPLATGEGWPNETLDLMRRLEAAHEAAEAERDAARIRFERGSAVVDALDRAQDALRTVMALYFVAWKARGPHGARRRERTDDNAKAFKFNAAYDEARSDFLDAAQAIVGTDF
jgi:hypothetical protein